LFKQVEKQIILFFTLVKFRAEDGFRIEEVSGGEDALTIILRLEADKKAVLGRVLVSKCISMSSSLS